MVRKGKDPWLHIKQVTHYVRTGEFLESVDQKEKNGIRVAAGNFVAEGMNVYYCGCKKGGEWPVKRRLAIEDKENMKKILEELHDKDGHKGSRSTQYKVIEKYYWPTITEDVRGWIKKCPKCQVCQKNKTVAPQLHLHPIKPKGRWDVLGMDLIGPLTLTPRGNNYIITITDLYTKWVVAYPLKDKSGPSVAMAIMNMMYSYGPPLKIITDQEKEFVNEVNKNVFSLFDIKHLVSSAYPPQTIKQTEKTNRTLKTALAKCCSENKDGWDMFINYAVYGMNTSCQATTKYTPFFLMYFREVRCQSDLNVFHESYEGVNFECEPGRSGHTIKDEIEASVEICKNITVSCRRPSMPQKIQLSGAQKRKAFKEKSDKNSAAVAKMQRLTEFSPGSKMENIEVIDEEPAPAVLSEEPPAFPSTSAENESNIPNQDIDLISHPTHASDVDSEVPLCDPDPATWFPVRKKHVSFWSKSPICQNKNDSDSYPESRRHYQSGQGSLDGHCCYFKNSMFYTSHDNGEQHLRKWLLYSPSKGAVYCFYCTLMSSRRGRFSSEDGFSHWKKAEEKMKSHEQSRGHRDSVLKFNLRCRESSHVDRELEKQVPENKKYWTEVLRRVVAVTVFLAERGLAFRSSEEIIGSKHNINFLGIMELIAQFDPFLMGHLKECDNPGSGKQSYLSPTIYEEIVLLMAKYVKNYIVTELKTAKYFSISLDSTPDLPHVDQLTVIVRYIVSGKPVERFLTFLQTDSQKAEALATALLEFLEKEGIDFEDCRGLSYNNGSNMSSHYTGMQTRLKNKNPAAVFIPYAAHSLNFVGQTAASCCAEAISYFGFIQRLFTFFSASTHRWANLMKSLEGNEKSLNVKSLPDTRWSARADATEVLVDGYNCIQNALRDIESDLEQTPEARYEAETLADKMDYLETALMAKIWNLILVQFNSTNEAFQGDKVDLKKMVDLTNSLEKFLESFRDRYEELELDAMNLCGNTDYKPTISRPGKRKKCYDANPTSTSQQVVLSSREKFRCGTFNVILDRLSVAIQEHRIAYQSLYDKFKVIVNLCSLSDAEIRTEAEKLITSFPRDFSNGFIEEIVQFAAFAKLRSCLTPFQQVILLHEEGLADTFPSVNVALRIYLSMMVTRCSGEKSFRKLALIKNYLRTKMTHERLSALCLLDVESSVLKMIQFEEFIEDFSDTKCRKRDFFVDIVV